MATCESEIKRLKAIQNHKREFEKRQQIIRDSLRGVDTKPNNKIVFDDDEPEVKKVKKTKSSNPVLFDSDDEDIKLTGHEFDNKPKLSGELIKLQGRYAHDERFVLDERFADEENPNSEQNENEEEIDEKAFNFKVLEDVLGKPVTYKQPFNNEKNRYLHRKSERKFKPMVRYDPEDKSHAQYEIKIEKPEPKKKKEKKTKQPTEVVAEEPPPVSNEIFFSVSENLTQSLKKEENEEEGFSLLKMFGRNVEENTDKRNEDFQSEAIEPKSKQYNPFKERNPFKYDSSDDENEDQSNEYIPKKEDKSSVFENQDFFFIVDDPRLLTLTKEEFLRPQNEEEVDFSARRRELKRIVKKKIHNIQRDNNKWKHNKTWKGHEKRKKR